MTTKNQSENQTPEADKTCYRHVNQLGITPAPWKFEFHTNRSYSLLNWNFCLSRNNENIKLMNAAPDLYEALRRIIDEPEYVHGFDDPCRCPKCQGIKALYKASGITVD